MFNSDMSILVKGIPTNEFRMGIGLRQGDLLSLFLFVLAVESLSGLVSKVSEVGDFTDFNVKGDCLVNILQFGDDTLLVGEGS